MYAYMKFLLKCKSKLGVFYTLKTILFILSKANIIVGRILSFSFVLNQVFIGLNAYSKAFYRCKKYIK